MTSATPLVAFAALYERQYDAVFRAALRVTGNSADAEDALQTVFLRILARGGDLDALTLSAAYFRRLLTPPSSRLLLLKERLRRAIATLDSEDASLFLLRHVEGLSNDELAAL